MRQWTATHLAKLARKISISAGKKELIYQVKLLAKVDQNILRKLASQVDDIVLSVEQMVKQQLQFDWAHFKSK